MSITNHLNKIKGAVYGKDVRGAIHDAIKECYDDASVDHDNANMEVKIARGTHNTLNDRLNESDEIQHLINAQLSESKDKINILSDENTEQSITLNRYANLVTSDDWSLALKQAILDVQDGGKIKLPKGTFEVSVLVDFSSDYDTRTSSKVFSIEGDSGGTILKGKADGDYVLKIDSLYTKQTLTNKFIPFNCSHVTISNLTIDCNGSEYGLFLSKCANIRIKDCSVYNYCSKSNDDVDSAGIHIDGAGMYRFRDVYLTSKYSVGCGIKIFNNAGDGVIDGVDIAGGGIGIFVGAGNCKVINSSIYGQSKHCIKTLVGTSSPHKFFAQFNQFENAGISMLSFNESSTGSANVNILNNTFWMNGKQDGLVLGNCQMFKANGNMFEYLEGDGIGNGKFGIKVNRACVYGEVNGNYMRKITDGGKGIYLDGCQIVEIKGNVCLNDVDNTSKVSFIELSDTPTLRVKIEGNRTNFATDNPFNLKINGTGHLELMIKHNYWVRGQVTDLTNIVFRYEETTLGIYNMLDSWGFGVLQGRFNRSPFRMGDYYLWVDFNDKLRIKKGKPTYDEDGALVGV